MFGQSNLGQMIFAQESKAEVYPPSWAIQCKDGTEWNVLSKDEIGVSPCSSS